MPESVIAALAAVERDRRPHVPAPDTSFWFDWLRRIGDGQDPRPRDRPESRADGVGHRRPRLEVLGGTVSGAAGTLPTRDLGAPE